MTDEHDSLDNDDIDIHLRAPGIVAARVLVLAAVTRYVALVTPSKPRQPGNLVAAERFDLVSWLQLEGLVDDVAPSERRFLDHDAATLTTDNIAAMSWRAESLVALGWALGMLPELVSPPEVTDPSPMLEAVPQPFDETGSFRQGPSLRDEAVIAHERERAELWHWRSDIADLQTAASVTERRALSALVRDVTREATESGLLARTGDGDFLVGGRPFLTLPVEERETVALIAVQRHHALNWLCGFGNTWDDVPLDL